MLPNACALSVMCWMLVMWCLLKSCHGLAKVPKDALDVESPQKPRICIGTSGRMSVPSNRTTHYNNLRDRYTNCTYVDGNLELTWLQESTLDLSFLKYIRVVTGYVLISYVDVERVVLPSLQIIRGRTLFKLNVHDKQFSLMITMSKMLHLEMPALRDILRGNAGMFNNYNLCRKTVMTINWDDILTGPDAEFVYVYNFNVTERNCEDCDSSCGGHCWGPGPDNCQRLSKVNCSPQCHGGRCFGPEPRQCCHLFCAGGCVGPTQSDCLSCLNFNDNGVCKQECPPMRRYNSITYSWEPNPNGKFAYGATCVQKCPEHLLKDSNACVRACPPKKKAVSGECVPCNGPCPKTCPVENNEIIHSGNVDRFKNCTILQGSLRVMQHSFDGYQEIDDNFQFGKHYGKMHPSRLEVFSNLQEITGFVSIDASHEDFRNLSFLRRLEVIGGRYLHELFSGLYIIKTSLKSLELVSLKKVRSGSVVIAENKHLCFADGINWKSFISQNQKLENKYEVIVEKNRNATECAADGLVCHDQCTDDGCWGPGPDSCLKCKQFKLGDRCLEACDSSLGMYRSSRDTCDLCDKECDGHCTGKGPDRCVRCKNVRDGPYCVTQCPETKYNASGECQPCHENCEGGCSGPENSVGLGGCVNCQGAILTPNGTVERCLSVNESCPVGYYFEFVGLQQQGQLKALAGKGICRKCHERCKNCTGFGFHVNVCQECMHYRNGEQCVDACPDDFYANDETSECVRCSAECRGCDGPGQRCRTCRNYRVYLDTADLDSGSKFNCTAHCPDSHPHKIFPEDGDDPYCSAEPGALPSATPEENFTVVIVSVVVTVVVLLIVVLGVVCKCLSDRKKEEMLKMTMMMSKEGLNEPLKVTNVKPNLAQLRIVKEAELRKGGILGFGAFGTVHRGVWVPEGENVKIPVAIKVLREDRGADTNKEILEEAYIMASLEHRNLLPLLAVCMTSQMMLVTQLMPLGCLVDYVRNNKDKVGSKPLLNWCTQIARGMAYLESRRLVHRDLAARNVLVQTPSLVKITDFGLAKVLDINEEEYKAAGGKMPIKWLALECIQHRIFNHKSDVWAFGVTVWELLTYGGRPYEDVPAKDVPDLLEKGERLPQPPSCTIEIYMLMIKCWMLDADSRPNFEELSAEFAKMSRDPGRYLVIPGDKLMRLPSYSQQDERELMRSLAASALDSPSDVLMDASEYLKPQGAASAFSTASGRRTLSLMTLEDDRMSVLGRPAGRERRHTHEEAGKQRLGSAGSSRCHGGDTLRSLDEMGDDDCFEPASGVWPTASGAAAAGSGGGGGGGGGGGSGSSSNSSSSSSSSSGGGGGGGGGQASGQPELVGGMVLRLPVDEDDYLMPSNGQPGAAPATYMDLVGDNQPAAGNAPSPQQDEPEDQFVFSMDNLEYHMMASQAPLHGCLGAGGTGSLSPHQGGSSSGSGRGLPAAATAPRTGPASFGGFRAGSPAGYAAHGHVAPAAGGGPYPGPAGVPYPVSAPASGTFGPAGGASSPNAVGVPVQAAAVRRAALRVAQAPPEYYNDLDRLKPPPSRRSETTV